jgi:hypothetical protein
MSWDGWVFVIVGVALSVALVVRAARIAAGGRWALAALYAIAAAGQATVVVGIVVDSGAALMLGAFAVIGCVHLVDRPAADAQAGRP